MKKLATVYKKGDKFFGRILFENALQPVEYFYIKKEHILVTTGLFRDFPNLVMVNRSRFEAEVAYTTLFKERAPENSLKPLEKPSMNDLIEHHKRIINGL